jgi:hypothetical protein
MSGRTRNNVTSGMVAVVSVVAIGMFAMGAVNLSGRTPGGQKITGTYTVTEAGAFTPNRDCSVPDAKDGTPVAIRNSAGEVMRIGRLTGGVGVKAAGDTTKASQCRFDFVLTKVKASETYEIRVGARDPRTVTRADLYDNQWHVDLS